MLTRFRQPGRLLLAFARLTCYNEFLFFRYNGSGAFLELPSSPGALLRLFLSTCVFLLALALGGPAFAQDDVPSAPIETGGRWEPLGQVPVDQAGAGRRGYALPGESADVAEPGTNQIGLHMVAANNFFREQTNDFLITQRYETHTLALDFRRGFSSRIVPRFELGAQVQLSERDSGFLNGFIAGFESLCFSMSGVQSAKNELRTLGTPLPLGAFVTKGGRTVYQAAGGGAGIGDFSLVAKALIRDAAPASKGTRVAVRAGLNVSGTSKFAEGNFAGIGMSLDQKVLSWAALHADLRANVAFDRVSEWNLPLKRSSFGFSMGPEFRLARDSSVSVQIDGNSTPYLPTGTTAFDKDYGSITIGLGHRFRTSRTAIVSQIYARENMNLPFRVRWNVDPDASFGIKIVLRPTSHQ